MKGVVLLAVAIFCVDEGYAFSPSSSSSLSKKISQVTQEFRRYQPLSFASIGNLLDDDDDDDVSLEEPPAEDYLLAVGELEGEDSDEAGAEDDGKPPAWYESQLRMAELRTKYRRHETDTGSPEYQIAGMSERINYLTGHMKTHPKDFSTRRGLVALVNKRRRLLNYLFDEDVQRYADIVNALGIRHKAPSRVTDRVEQYGRFPQQKAVKTHLLKNNRK